MSQSSATVLEHLVAIKAQKKAMEQQEKELLASLEAEAAGKSSVSPTVTSSPTISTAGLPNVLLSTPLALDVTMAIAADTPDMSAAPARSAIIAPTTPHNAAPLAPEATEPSLSAPRQGSPSTNNAVEPQHTPHTSDDVANSASAVPDTPLTINDTHPESPSSPLTMPSKPPILLTLQEKAPLSSKLLLPTPLQTLSHPPTHVLVH